MRVLFFFDSEGSLPNQNSTLATQSLGMLVSALIVLAGATPLFAEDAGAIAGSPAQVATLLANPLAVTPKNPYIEASSGHFSPVVAGALQRVYVPNVLSSDVDVIDPATLQVIDHFRVRGNPQHIVPSWDLKTLWIASSRHRHRRGGLTPIDPMTGMPGKTIPVSDAYNLYFTPDGKFAIVVAEAMERLEFRDPYTMLLKSTLAVPRCRGLNHADFSADGRYAIFTCEFEGSLVKIDLAEPRVDGYLKLSKGGMPQDIRISPDAKSFYVADMMADGVFVVDGDTLAETDFIPTGIGAHGLYPSRDATKLYVSNRGSHEILAKPRGPGNVSVIDFATHKVETTWFIPGGGSPDMGNVSADGKVLWLSGRYDGVVYAINTSNGSVKSIAVGRQPHGLTVWPQPGRYSLGHTGNMR